MDPWYIRIILFALLCLVVMIVCVCVFVISTDTAGLWYEDVKKWIPLSKRHTNTMGNVFHDVMVEADPTTLDSDPDRILAGTLIPRMPWQSELFQPIDTRASESIAKLTVTNPLRHIIVNYATFTSLSYSHDQNTFDMVSIHDYVRDQGWIHMKDSQQQLQFVLWIHGGVSFRLESSGSDCDQAEAKSPLLRKPDVEDVVRILPLWDGSSHDWPILRCMLQRVYVHQEVTSTVPRVSHRFSLLSIPVADGLSTWNPSLSETPLLQEDGLTPFSVTSLETIGWSSISHTQAWLYVFSWAETPSLTFYRWSWEDQPHILQRVFHVTDLPAAMFQSVWAFVLPSPTVIHASTLRMQTLIARQQKWHQLCLGVHVDPLDPTTRTMVLTRHGYWMVSTTTAVQQSALWPQWLGTIQCVSPPHLIGADIWWALLMTEDHIICWERRRGSMEDSFIRIQDDLSGMMWQQAMVVMQDETPVCWRCTDSKIYYTPLMVL